MPQKTLISKTRANRLAEQALILADDIEKGRVNLLAGTLCAVINQKVADELADNNGTDRIKLKKNCEGPGHCAMGELLFRTLPKTQYRKTMGRGDPRGFVGDFLKGRLPDRIDDAAEEVMSANDASTVEVEDIILENKGKIPRLDADVRFEIAQTMRSFGFTVLAVAHGQENRKSA